MVFINYGIDELSNPRLRDAKPVRRRFIRGLLLPGKATA
jgi:hypothetical protein